MAETALTRTTAPDKFSQTGVALTMTAADVANGNSIAGATDLLVIAHNTGGSPYTVTITSQADPRTGRTGDVSAQSLAPDEYRVFRLSNLGWANSSRLIIIAASNAAVKIGVVVL